MKFRKSLFDCFLVAMLVLTCLLTLPTRANAATSGSCGANVTWSLSSGILTISGTGAMDDYVRGEYAPWYSNYTAIQSVVIEDGVTTIGDWAFHACVSLTTISIPNSVTTIGSYAFDNCSWMTSITIPDSVTAIGDYAFNRCENLTSITIPDRVTLVGDSAFSCCFDLTGIWVNENNPNYSSDGRGVLFNKDKTTLFRAPGAISGSYIIPESVDNIYNYAFSGCADLTGVTIPDSVTAIEAGVFNACDSLTAVTIPDSVITIGNSAFYYSRNLKDVTIGNSVVTIGESAFRDCASLTGITIPNSVTAIGGDAFYNCDNLTGITIPDSVTDIGSQVFYDCNSLKNVTIGNGVTNIGNSAFYSCDNLTSVTVGNGVTTIGSHAFDTCVSLTAISIPNSVTTIGSHAFYSCDNLASVAVGNSVTAIGNSAFSGCGSLTSITIPDGVTFIGHSAFYDCASLTGIWVSSDNSQYSSDERGVLHNKNKTTLIQAPGAISGHYAIAESVTSISERAFYDCSNLISVVFENSITVVGRYMFSYCDSLAVVALPDSITTIGSDAFFDCGSLADVYYSGSRSQWYGISIGFDNDSLTNAMIHYNHIHDYSAKQPLIINATCTAPGYAEYTCVCTKKYSEYTPALEHDFTGKAVEKAPTCDEAGYTGVHCIRCGAFRKDTTTKALGHKQEEIPAKAATCTQAGHSQYIQCARCKRKSENPTIYPALGHSYTATCDATCNTCGEARTPAAHKYDNACDTTCNVCGASRNITHTYKTTITKATISKDGSAVKKCAVCGKVAGSTTIRYAKSIKLYATSYIYNGKVKNPTVIVKDTAGKTLVKDTDYTVSYASGRKNVGTYTVTVKGKGNYAFTKTLRFKIKPIDISECSAKLSTTSYTYNGKAKTPSVTVKNAAGKTLKKGTDYTVTYASGRKNAGTYKVTVKMKGNYSGTKALTFKIKPISVSKCSVKLYTTSYVYNGKAKTPTVTVKNSAGKTLKKGTDYTVTYAKGRKNVGTYKVTIKMKGNYSGTKVLTFKIVPKAASINKLTAKSKAFTVKLNRVTTQSTGYQIQYSTSSKFTSAKTVNVTSYKTSTKTISGLKKGKKYYVRVRTYKAVSGKKYYSNWSSYKSVKTK